MVAARRCGWFFIVAVRVGNSDVDLWLLDAALFYLHLAFLSGADARRCSGGDCTAFIDGRKATLQYCFHSGDGWHYVWCTVYVAIGLIVLSRLFCS